MSKHRTLLGLTTALALTLLAPRVFGAAAAEVTLHETGSSLLYPLFQLWIPAYTAAHPDIAFVTAETGSGNGFIEARDGKVEIGGSDAYMSDQEAEHNRGVLNIPLAISAQTVNYNVPEIKGTTLKMDGPTLAAIYRGKVTMWDAPEIAALNPDVKLPHQTIVPIRRGDSSGDTFVFTQFLDFSTQWWEDAVGYGTNVNWPNVAGEQTATNNDGMVKTIAATPYSVGYVGVSYHDGVEKAGLGTASIKNQAGKFLLPDDHTVDAGASQLDPRTPPDERLTLAFAPGEDSYPIINYEYAVVLTHHADAATAQELRHFLLWAIAYEGGNAPKYLEPVRFIPLPDFIRALSEAQISKIQ